ALVDVPLFWALMCFMFGVVLLFNHICPLQAVTVLPMIICATGYGVSLILLIYLIASMFRKGRSNRYLWSFIFILVNFIFYMISDLYDEASYFIFSTLIPMYPLLGWL
ncbi:ABCA8 protein, partial [Anseranas semipalmata]|nr:ABCA8 protein [Anseranas semipalmata]